MHSGKQKKTIPVLGTTNEKPAFSAGFRFSKLYGAKMGASWEYINYRPAQLYNHGQKWYVFYSFLDPSTGKFKRFKVYEDINRIKDPAAKSKYGRNLAEMVNMALKDGYDPFAAPPPEKLRKTWTLNQALSYYKQLLPDMDLREKSKSCYLSMVKIVQESRPACLNFDINSLDEPTLLDMLDAIRREKKWKNSTYNGYFGYFKTFLFWCKKKKIIRSNPLEGTEKKKTVPEKNRAFSLDEYQRLFAYLEENNTGLYWFCRFVYYTGTRPKSETRLLQMKHVDFDKGQIEVPAGISKSKKYARIPIPTELLEYLEQFRKLPPEWYIFTIDGKPGPTMAGHNYFSVSFLPVRKHLKLSTMHTIYSLKHTRTIHLANAGVTSYDIQRLWRHSSLDMTEKYMRDLGLNISRDAVNVKV